MKAPDKIYLERDKETEKIDFRWGDRPVVHSAYEHIEYIRKDALLAWAEEEMMKAARSSEAYGRRNAFMDVIDKINSL